MELPVSVPSEETIVKEGTLTSIEQPSDSATTRALASSTLVENDQASSAKPTGGRRVTRTAHSRARTKRSAWRRSFGNIAAAHDASRLVPRGASRISAFSRRDFYLRGPFKPRARHFGWFFTRGATNMSRPSSHHGRLAASRRTIEHSRAIPRGCRAERTTGSASHRHTRIVTLSLPLHDVFTFTISSTNAAFEILN